MSQLEASQRFDKIATNYANSEVHSMSPTIKRLHSLLDSVNELAVCDVACGAGHLALSFAGKADRIVGVDPSQNMLEAFKALAADRKMQVEAVEAFSELLPFPDHQFDLVASRLAPHHFSDIELAVKEMSRIAKPGKFVAIIDLEGDENPTIDDFNHQLEMHHDPTHIRSYTATRWRLIFEKANLLIETLETKLSEFPSGVTVSRWCEIAASGPTAEAEIRRLLNEASSEVLEHLGITRSGHEFLMPIRTLLVLGRKPLES